jgi:sacsin
MAESFDQEEPLTVRLGGLLIEYPPGVSILKELLQNADDAGASTIVELVLYFIDF